MELRAYLCQDNQDHKNEIGDHQHLDSEMILFHPIPSRYVTCNADYHK